MLFAVPLSGLCSMPGAQGAGACVLRPVPVAARPAAGPGSGTANRGAIRRRKNKSMPSPGGQVSGMPGKAGARTWVGGPGRCGIPSTSTRAITPRPEGKLRIVAGGRAGYAGHLNVVDLRGMLPSVRGVIGLRQVDGMPHQGPLVSDEAERGRAAPGRRGLSVGRRISA